MLFVHKFEQKYLIYFTRERILSFFSSISGIFFIRPSFSYIRKEKLNTLPSFQRRLSLVFGEIPILRDFLYV